jgi:hypothetical protein
MVGCAFGSSSFWTLGRWDSPLSDDQCLSREICNKEVCPEFDPCLGLDLSDHLWFGCDLFKDHMSCSHFLTAEV